MRNSSGQHPLEERSSRCNLAQSMQSSPVEFWPTRQHHDAPANELRSMREQRRAWINQESRDYEGVPESKELFYWMT
jgi:hypothetical protein